MKRDRCADPVWPANTTAALTLSGQRSAIPLPRCAHAERAPAIIVGSLCGEPRNPALALPPGALGDFLASSLVLGGKEFGVRNLRRRPARAGVERTGGAAREWRDGP